MKDSNPCGLLAAILSIQYGNARISDLHRALEIANKAALLRPLVWLSSAGTSGRATGSR